MKNFYIILLSLISIHGFTQNLKTTTRDVYHEVWSGIGKATFSYYEDENYNETRHGNYSYSFKVSDHVPIVDVNRLFSLSITGKYKEGLKDGKWSFVVTEKYIQELGSVYFNGNTKLIANFKNGKPHGLWQLTRNKTYYKYEFYSLNQMENPTKISITANFDNGVLIGDLSFNEVNDYFTGWTTAVSAKLDEKGNIIRYKETSTVGIHDYQFSEGLFLKHIYKDLAKANTKFDDSKVTDWTEKVTAYKISPELFKLKDEKFRFDFLKYFTQDIFNFAKIDGDMPEFDGGYYKEIVHRPQVSFISLLPWILNEYLNNKNVDIAKQTEEQCIEICNTIKELRITITKAQENNGLLSDDRILTDYEQYIPKLDSAEVFFTNAYESKKAERLKKEEEAKLLAEKIDSNNKLLKQAKENNQKIVELCITFKKESVADLSALSPDRCIKCAKSYSASKNAYVYDCIMINKKQKNIWLAYSKYQTTMNFYSQELLKNSINYMSNSNMNITLSSLNIGFNNQDVFEEINNSTEIESANKYNENLSIIIAIQKKLLTVLNDKKLTKTLNKELNKIEAFEEISNIILTQ
ncbi:MAG: hypothetical protein PHE08_09795 [Bacteroidales bacterium]|nr:hypothetical protein [Bacteroidales bacterium]